MRKMEGRERVKRKKGRERESGGSERPVAGAERRGLSLGFGVEVSKCVLESVGIFDEPEQGRE